MENIYIYVLELGYKKQNGITYTDVKNDIVKKFDIDFSFEFERNFRKWFFENFFEKEAENSLLSINKTGHHSHIVNLPFERSLNNIAFIKGDAINKYVDYLELRDARISSRKATNLAIISIIIATFSVFTQIILTKSELPLKKIEVTVQRDSIINSKFQDSTCCKFRTSKTERL